MIVGMYSITDKQKYIFSSPKLKDNIGASVLIDAVFSNITKKIIEELGGINYMDSNEDEVFEGNTLNFKKARLIYLFHGGGNAMIAFKDLDAYKTFNERLTKNVFLESGGGINIVFTYTKIEDSSKIEYNKLYKDLQIKLSEEKRKSTPPYPLLSQSITENSLIDGLPKIKHSDEESSIISKHKREALKKYAKDYFKEDISGYTKNFDELISKGENRLGVVHIDGNNMGKQFKEIMSKVGDFKEALIVLKRLGKEIDNVYKSIFKEVKSEIGEDKIRPIVLAGDDVTYVISGELALYSAEQFLKKLKRKENLEITIDNRKIEFHLSACAGVAIVNKHYPFYRAYRLAEELSDSAKKRAKNLKEKTDKGEFTGNWIDFQLLITSYIKDLESIKEDYYEASGDNKFNKRLRPYSLDRKENDPLSFESFKKLYEDFSNWPKNKLKTFRNTFIKPETEIEKFISQIGTRDLKPSYIWDERYKIPNKRFVIKIEELKDFEECAVFTPYFDVLETYGYYKKPNEE